MDFRRFHSRLRASVAVLLVAIGTQASAQGVTRVQQSDGSVRFYNDVRMSLNGETLWITAADRKGALEIVTGACSFSGELQRCHPSAVTLHQHGRTHAIAVDRGTVYFNLTADSQPLRHSSQRLAPKNVLVSFHTVRGTYVSVQGALDEVKR
ncbi:MAG: hypothetical protein WAN59_10030 [Candidatus Baltobacteraceae bacterium]